MPDLINRVQPDRSKINMHEPYEVKYWTHALGVSKNDLQKVVERSATPLLRSARNWVCPTKLKNDQTHPSDLLRVGLGLREPSALALRRRHMAVSAAPACLASAIGRMGSMSLM
ncbi:Protein of unknown function [Bradyrhizobium brasilense]|uniref:DUF3606 domain-containing protein n=1 Tax=Bradyrhizobium brasilense TaxID=1419277 RepID=A0A1G6QWP8_9BRAD|nr:Protein of unknown function [Bradyrhizobium brasilense]